MNAELISAIAALILAIIALAKVFGQKSQMMADIAVKLVEPMSKRIDKLDSDLCKEQKARQIFQKKVIRLVEGIKILTRQLQENGIEPEFVLKEGDETGEDIYDEN